MGNHENNKSTNNIYQTLVVNTPHRKQGKSLPAGYDPEKDPNSFESKKKENEIEFGFFLAQMKIADERKWAFEQLLKEKNKTAYLLAKLAEWHTKLKNFFLSLANNLLKNSEQLIKMTREQIDHLNQLKNKINEKIKWINDKISWFDNLIHQKREELAQLKEARINKIASYAITFKNYFSEDSLINFKTMQIKLIFDEKESLKSIDTAYKNLINIKPINVKQISGKFSDKLISGEIDFEKRDAGLKNEIKDHIKNIAIEASPKIFSLEEKEMFAERNLNTPAMKKWLKDLSEVCNEHMLNQDVKHNYGLQNDNLDLSAIKIRRMEIEDDLNRAEETKAKLEEAKETLEKFKKSQSLGEEPPEEIKEILDNKQVDIENMVENKSDESSLELTQNIEELTNLLDEPTLSDVCSQFENDMQQDDPYSDDDFANFRP